MHHHGPEPCARLYAAENSRIRPSFSGTGNRVVMGRFCR
ncbi:hypothetical protein PTH_2374 [Pelotomaculum thermopropionicum SI]|uniref:Uncharacterized protein n=1 Tax=Pelotomaculum thermopropionicum (strain DSM 13744 / JCM 10971 / SI) TaxID=370438 RepID=A5CZM9_PELTS|nr:hypothetical protein PTH_2374 [Pelotomaculum thermopropionicum SI]